MSGLSNTGSKDIQVAYDFIQSSCWMAQACYDQISIDVSGNTTTLSYYEDGALLGKAIIVFTDDDTFSLSMERYLTEDDNDPLLDDDGTELFLN